jgi:cytochrome b561
MCIAFIPYFANVAVHFQQPAPTLRQLSLFALATIVQIAIMAAGHAYLRLRSPEDATTPPDERDRAIMSRSVTCAYYVLITGMILVGCVMPFNSGGWTIINAAILMIVVAELVHYGTVVFSYRRQA